MNREGAGLPCRLRWAMGAAGLNVPQLAEKSAVSESALKKWLAESSRPRTANLKPVAGALNVTVGWLLGQTEYGGPDPEALQDAQQAERTAQINAVVPHMKAWRAAEEEARHDEQDAQAEREAARRLGLPSIAPGKEAVSASPDAHEAPEMDEAEERFLFALSDNIERIYKELDASLSRERLRALVVQQYRAICDTTTAEERRTQRATLVALIGRQLRRDILRDREHRSEAEAG